MASVKADFKNLTNGDTLDIGFVYPFISKQRGYMYFYGIPRQQRTIFKEASVFPASLWALIFGTVVVFIIVFNAVRVVYGRLQGKWLCKGVVQNELAIMTNNNAMPKFRY